MSQKNKISYIGLIWFLESGKQDIISKGYFELDILSDINPNKNEQIILGTEEFGILKKSYDYDRKKFIIIIRREKIVLNNIRAKFINDSIMDKIKLAGHDISNQRFIIVRV